MAYLKPPKFVSKVFNRLAMRTGVSGTQTLTAPGRTTGEPRRVPVIPFEHEGAKYIVSTRGEAEWVRNVRAAGHVDLNGTRYDAIEVPVAERGPIIETYRAKAGRTVKTYWNRLPDDADHPTFRLSSS